MPQEMTALRPTLDTGPAPAAAAPADRRRPNPQAAAYVRALRLEVAQWLPEALIATLDRLKDAARQGTSPAARADADEAADALHANGRPWCRQLERAVQDALSAELANGGAPAAEALSPFVLASPDDAPVALTLTLMDEDRIDEEIAVSRLVQVADVEAESALRDLAALCSGLRAFNGISPEANPMRPSVVAGALRQGAQAFGLRKPVRLLLLRELGAAVGKMLPTIYDEQRQLLLSWGVTPAHFTMRAGGDDASPAAAGDAPALTLRRLGGAADAGTPGGVDPQAAADLMARLLTSMMSRFTMAEGTRDLIRRLDAPARRIASADPEIWHSLDHPLWQLLDRLVAVGSVHGEAAPSGPGALADSLEQAVRQLEGAEAPDAGQCHAALASVDVALNDLVDEQRARVAPQADTLEDRPPRSAVEDGLREQLRNQARTAGAPAPLERFLAGAWAEVLADIGQRHGAESSQMRSHAELVDRLIEATTRRAGRPLAPATLGRLLMLARLALQDARMAAPRIESELAALQDVLCSPTRARPAAAVDLELDGEAPLMPALRPFSPTLPDERALALTMHDALTTVQVDPFGAEGAAAVATNAWLDSLDTGTFCRIFLMDRWMNVQVIWRSQSRSMFVFKSRHGGCTHSLARRVLEKLRTAGLATTIERGEWVAQVMRELAGEHRPH